MNESNIYKQKMNFCVNTQFHCMELSTCFEHFYPLNPSLGEEFRRLFQHREVHHYENVPLFMIDYNTQPEVIKANFEDVVEEFKANGVESDIVPLGQGARPILKTVALESTSKATLKQAHHRKAKGECVFCRNNGETKSYSRSHLLKDRFGKVTCPILRAYICPICGSSGDSAHTIKYCPYNKHKDAIKDIFDMKEMYKLGKSPRVERKLQ